jgi:hypothetical protein
MPIEGSPMKRPKSSRRKSAKEALRRLRGLKAWGERGVMFKSYFKVTPKGVEGGRSNDLSIKGGVRVPKVGTRNPGQEIAIRAGGYRGCEAAI